MMKRAILGLFVLSLSVAMIGCSSGSSDESNPSTTTAAPAGGDAGTKGNAQPAETPKGPSND